jgi:1-phosphofructokinase family hexose kinase
MRKRVKFFCLCVSHAIDATVTLPSAPVGKGEIFKDVRDEENVGGKAFNVARWLAIRGADVVCGGLLGEDNDISFVREMERYGIADGFLRVPGSTRRNEMIVWPGGSVKLNRAAFPLIDAKIANGKLSEDILERLIGEDSSSQGIVILSGSLPASFDKSFYNKAISYFKSLGMTTILDASGEAFRLGLEAGPDLIKPNAEECEAVVGFVPKTPEDFIRATRLLREKSRHVIISDGGKGAWFDGEFISAAKVDVVDTTAAGDTLLAEYCWRSFAEGDNLTSDNARWAVAAGSAACTMPGGAPAPKQLVEKLYGSTKGLKL